MCKKYPVNLAVILVQSICCFLSKQLGIQLRLCWENPQLPTLNNRRTNEFFIFLFQLHKLMKSLTGSPLIITLCVVPENRRLFDMQPPSPRMFRFRGCLMTPLPSGIMCNKDLCRYADMSTDSRPTPSDTSPPLGRYFTDTQPALRSFCQLLILSSIFSTQLLNDLFQPFERGFQWPSSFFGLSVL